MRLRVSLSFWTATFTSSLGIAAVTGCSSPDDADSSRQEPTANGGTGAAGGSMAAGAAGSDGGASSGGGAQGGEGNATNGGAGNVSNGGTGNVANGGTGNVANGGAGNTGNAGSGSGGTSYTCDDPAPILGLDGQPSGYVTCGNDGWQHRESAETCVSNTPRVAWACPFAADAGYFIDCRTDADCTASPNGYCAEGLDTFSCICAYGCTSDADCAPGSICQCGDPVGQCVPAKCTTDAECGPGRLCASYNINPYCGGTGFACQTGQDECMADVDCAGACTIEDGASHRTCTMSNCVIGRPFLVRGEIRTAGLGPRLDWSAALAPCLEGLSDGERGSLAGHWAYVGQMEHASIAAFARFALQLLALGAPPELIEATTRAQADETRHARMAFALAGAYGGAPVGPGRLALDGALEAPTLREVLRLVVLEGCIGETVAAIEAAEARARAADPAVCGVLTEVAADETRHAELAFQFVKWALATCGVERADFASEILTIVEAEIAALPPLQTRLDGERLEAHGMVSEALRREVRRRVLGEVVKPCLAALCIETEPRRGASMALHFA